MRESQLSGRQILMVVLVVVILMSGFMAYVFIVLPSNDDPVGSRRSAMGSGIVAGLASVWFLKLVIDAVRDKRRGIERGPAKVSGWFDIFFGVLAAGGGIVCSVVTYSSAVSAGGGIWTLYYGMIGWGLVQAFLGWRKLGDEGEPNS